MKQIAYWDTCFCFSFKEKEQIEHKKVLKNFGLTIIDIVHNV